MEATVVRPGWLPGALLIYLWPLLLQDHGGGLGEPGGSYPHYPSPSTPGGSLCGEEAEFSGVGLWI